MPDYRFERECRTPYSEVYLITDDDEVIGRINLHYTNEVVNATMCVGESMTAEEIRDLVDVIDEEIILSANVERNDFIVAVHQGREAGIFSDEELDDEDCLDDDLKF